MISSAFNFICSQIDFGNNLNCRQIDFSNNPNALSKKILDKVPLSILNKMTYIGAALTAGCAVGAAVDISMGYTRLGIRIAELGKICLPSYFANSFSVVLPPYFANSFSVALIVEAIVGLSGLYLNYKIYDQLSEYRDQRALKLSQEVNKPLGLIIQAVSDDNGAFSAVHSPLCPEAVKKYNLQKVKVKTAHEFFQAVKFAGQSKKISLLWVKAHGDSDSIQLGDNFSLFKQQIQAYDSFLKNNLHQDSIIILDSCSTGEYGPGENFASEFSKSAPGKVYAASGGFSGSPVFHSDGTISLSDGRKDVTRVYEHGVLQIPKAPKGAIKKIQVSRFFN